MSSMPNTLKRRRKEESGVCRILSLPAECIKIIVQGAGMSSRAVCKQFYTLFGSLNCGLRLSHISTTQALKCVLDYPNRSSRLHSLDLSRVSARVQNSTLTRVATICSHLKTLILIDCIHISSIGLKELAPLAPTLEHLDITGCVCASHNILDSLLALTSLETLRVSESTSLWITSQRTCLQLLPRLRSFHVSPPPNMHTIPETLGNDQFDALVALTQLEHLALPFCCSLNSAGFLKIRQLSNLTSLQVARCSSLPLALPFAHLAHLHALRQLHIEYIPVINGTPPSVAAITNLSHLTLLQDVKLVLPCMTDSYLAAIATLARLTSLAIHLNGLDIRGGATEAGLRHLRRHASSLRSLRVPLLRMQTVYCNDLAALTGLTQLHLSHATGALRAFRSASLCTGLLDLHVEAEKRAATDNAYIKGEMIASLSSLTCLTVRCALADIDIAMISRHLPALRHLEVGLCCKLPCGPLAFMIRLRNLEHLSLTGLHTGDSSLDHLTRFKQLTCLELRDCHAINGSWMKLVKGMTNLQRLALSNCSEVDDVGLFSLLPPPASLQQLQMTRLPKVYNASVMELQRQCRMLYVWHRNAFVH